MRGPWPQLEKVCAQVHMGGCSCNRLRSPARSPGSEHARGCSWPGSLVDRIPAPPPLCHARGLRPALGMPVPQSQPPSLHSAVFVVCEVFEGPSEALPATWPHCPSARHCHGPPAAPLLLPARSPAPCSSVSQLSLPARSPRSPSLSCPSQRPLHYPSMPHCSARSSKCQQRSLSLQVWLCSSAPPGAAGILPLASKRGTRASPPQVGKPGLLRFSLAFGLRCSIAGHCVTRRVMWQVSSWTPFCPFCVSPGMCIVGFYLRLRQCAGAGGHRDPRQG